MNAGLSVGLGLAGLAAGALLGRLGYAFGVIWLIARTADLAAARTALSVLWPIAWCAHIVLVVGVWQAPDSLPAPLRARHYAARGGTCTYYPATMPP